MLKESQAHADKILAMLKQADEEGQKLFIILTGKPCSGKSTITGMITKGYQGAVFLNSEVAAFRYVDPIYMWLNTHIWGSGLAVIRYEDNASVEGAPSLITMVRHRFEGYLYRKRYNFPEQVTPCHILAVMDSKSYDSYCSLKHYDSGFAYVYAEL